MFIDDDPLDATITAGWSCRFASRSTFAGRRPFQVRALPGRDRLPGPALAPGEESPGQPRPIKVEVVSESRLTQRELTPYDTVVLCNVAQFSQPEVAALDDFLRQGGGVVIFGGDQVVVENYNRLLYEDGNGLLPAPLAPASATPPKRRRVSCSIRSAIAIPWSPFIRARPSQ